MKHRVSGGTKSVVHTISTTDKRDVDPDYLFDNVILRTGADITGALPGSGLHAGDADMDLDFDQLDLVKVQVAAKYLTGQAATWGEGDWDGGPGGYPGEPPPGPLPAAR